MLGLSLEVQVGDRLRFELRVGAKVKKGVLTVRQY